MKRVLLWLPTASYRNDDFLAAAKTLDVEIISVANYCHQLAPLWGMSPIQSVPFDQPEVAVMQVLAALGREPDAVLAVDDSGLELAALLREHLRLPGNSSRAVRLTARQARVPALAAKRRSSLSAVPSARQRCPNRIAAAAASLPRGGQSALALFQPRRDPR